MCQQKIKSPYSHSNIMDICLLALCEIMEKHPRAELRCE